MQPAISERKQTAEVRARDEQLSIALSLARGNSPAVTSMTNRLALIAGAIEKAMRVDSGAPDLLEACKFFMGALDDGDLLRDTSKDHNPDWHLKALKFICHLKKAQEASAKAEGRA